ncbi:MAG TPA: hypothetical protein VFS92_08565 [Planctomycetota bacterium]|nr:hypothetical protein [Planctomycetota bacterium]
MKLLVGMKDRYGTISRTEGTISAESVMSKERPLEWLHRARERDYHRAKEEVLRTLLRAVAADGVVSDAKPSQSSRLLIGEIMDAIVDLRQRMETVRRLRELLENAPDGDGKSMADTESRMRADALALEQALQEEIERARRR